MKQKPLMQYENGNTRLFRTKAENIEGADLIIYTAAIMADNPELIAAKASGVHVLEEVRF